MKKKCLKVICFMLGLVLIFSGLQTVLNIADHRVYENIQGFYAEEEDSLDVVYVGSSNVYSFWQSTLAWKDYGLASYALSIPGMPAVAMKYVITECRKTQPDALYILNLNVFKTMEINENKLHHVANRWPLSLNKLKMIHALTESQGYEGADKLEFYFPLLRFHPRWNELTSQDFDFSLEGLKGAVHYAPFLKSTSHSGRNFHYTEERGEVTEKQERVLSDLLSYCEEESIQPLFVILPQGDFSEADIAQMNTLADMVEEQGYDVVNLLGKETEIGLRLIADYYDVAHANIHGSIKYTYYFGQYLMEHYDFTDKRTDPDYESWNIAAEEYDRLISPYVLDFELLHEERDYSLAAPAITCSVAETGIKISWDPVNEADGYRIYRRVYNSETAEYVSCECIAEVDASVLTFEDQQAEANIIYNYTIAPIRYDGTETLYGNFSVAGVSAKLK